VISAWAGMISLNTRILKPPTLANAQADEQAG
jgi:hypothetical protein